MFHVKQFEITDKLKYKAHQLGLAAVGIAPAIDEVRSIYGWSRCIICAAMSYLPPEKTQPCGAPFGLVARIAQGADYHKVMRQKLAALAEVISTEQPCARIEICVDTSPLPERRLAVCAGIGHRGKNGCLFVNGYGSWVALGEIVTDAPLRYDFLRRHTREFDICGTCTRCIDACPTNAIVAPGVIDRSKCLSALTQQSTSIPIELRGALNNRIYGCDICQDACPKNSTIRPTNKEFAQSAFPGQYPSLIPLIALSRAEYAEAVANSSIGWIRRTRIRRNAAIAAGNLACKDAIGALKQMLSEQNTMLRETAKWAIEEICRPNKK